ncbi:hypothetical protein H9P43_003952 [Blastocladiella emersonii ATCC 22665]|nr:hypothetical protein H9P43_003952 [Blastocladiella emersonii ATCC 22665]
MQMLNRRYSLEDLTNTATSQLAGEASTLPHVHLDEEAGVMLCVGSVDPATRSDMSIFAKALEDHIFHNNVAAFDRHVVDEYPLTSLAEAAWHVVEHMRALVCEGGRIRIALVGHQVGGLVAVEAVRAFLAHKSGPGAKDDWVRLITIEGIVTLDTPHFLYEEKLLGLTQHTLLLAHAGEFAVPRKPRNGSLRRQIITSLPARAISRGLFGPSMRVTAKAVSGVSKTSLVSQWDSQMRFMSPVIKETFDARTAKFMDLRKSGIPVVAIVTRIQGAVPESFAYIPPKRLLPAELPKEETMRLVNVTADAAIKTALDAANAALKNKGDAATFNKLINECAAVIGNWGKSKAQVA